MRYKDKFKVTLAAFASMLALGSLVSCSDEPDSDNYYTFTGEMASDFLKNNEQYSEFTKIVERANLMDLLATYGHYTCFVPSNDAVAAYLSARGLNSIDQLSDADCDTIARTHIINNIYSTYDMSEDRIHTPNMLGRYISTEQRLDNDSNAVVYLEGMAHIYYELKDDSVENGIMQPVDMVIEKSNRYIADILRDNPTISLFYEALVATGVSEEIQKVEDPNWDPKAYKKYYYKSDIRREVAWVPDTRKYGYTAFVEPDSLMKAKFDEYGISTANGNLRAMYDLAVKIYDPVYGSGNEKTRDDLKEGWKFENLRDSVNPLKRFIRYHIMNRYVAGTADLNSLVITEKSKVRNECMGFDQALINPVEWFETLLPHTMLKVERLTMNKDEKGRDCRGNGIAYERYLNRRYAAPDYMFEGALVDANIETEYVHDALNGHYFYVNDLVVFSKDVRDKVQNMRIRMDFSTIFPEVMTNQMRQVGKPWAGDPEGLDVPDDAAVPKYGKNFWFPLGYLENVTFSETGMLVLRRPHAEFWSWQGDEWNLFGDYDFTFRIPPVPFEGEWQMRLGFAATATRGVMQTYFGSDPKHLEPQGIPLDMVKPLNDESYLGKEVPDDDPNLTDYYNKMTSEEKAEEQKLLKNLGVYRDPRSSVYYELNDGKKRCALGCMHMYRRILCQYYLYPDRDYYIRFRVASDGKGNNNEFMLDFFEMVPRTVYGVDGEGAMEDDL